MVFPKSETHKPIDLEFSAQARVGSGIVDLRDQSDLSHWFIKLSNPTNESRLLVLNVEMI
jgi:hypothetical protein